MVQNKSFSGRLGKFAIYTFVLFSGLVCLLPLCNIVAISFSSSEAVAANAVGLVPINFTTNV